MNAALAGALIRRERLKRDWSQAGLCRGLCAVSYLSKIEQGKAAPGPELAGLLLARLGLAWREPEEGLAALVERGYEALFSGAWDEGEALLAELDARREALDSGPLLADAALLRAAFREGAHPARTPELEGLEAALDRRQRAVLLLLRGRAEELLETEPSALAFYEAGRLAYQAGRYALATERLDRAWGLAAEAGAVRLMLYTRVYLAACCSNMLEYERMEAHHRVAARIARALGDLAELRTIAYNRACTALELGRAEEAYAYFSALPDPGPLDLHKLAVACERLGRRDEALAALARAEAMAPADHVPEGIQREMLAVVRMRLEDPGYLRDPAYGARLMALFSRLRRELAPGFAGFHLPWALEWLTASRQYKQVAELLLDFPGYAAMKRL